MFDSPRAAFITGAQHIAPILLAALSFGLIVGVISADIGLSAAQGIGASAIIFAGASQLVTLELLNADAVVWVIVLSAVMVNLRHVIYSASISHHLKPLSAGWKLLLSYLLIDQIYALGIAHFDKYPDTPHKEWYHLGMGIPIWITWMAATVIGFFIGDIIPDEWSLEFVIPLMFLGLLVPAIKSKPYLAAAIVGGSVALMTTHFPNNLGLITATLCGIATGVLLERDS